MSPLISIQDYGESGGKTGQKADSLRRKRGREKRLKSRCSMDKLFLYSLFLTSVYLLIIGAEAMVALDHTQWHTHTIGRNPLDEGSASCRDLYLATHNTHERATSMPPAGFQPSIPASERPQTLALDRAPTGIGYNKFICARIWRGALWF